MFISLYLFSKIWPEHKNVNKFMDFPTLNLIKIISSFLSTSMCQDCKSSVTIFIIIFYTDRLHLFFFKSYLDIFIDSQIFLSIYTSVVNYFFFINLSWPQTFQYINFYVYDLLFVEFKRRSDSSHCLPGTVSEENHRAEPATHLSEVHLSGTEWWNCHSRFSHNTHKQQLKGENYEYSLN